MDFKEKQDAENSSTIDDIDLNQIRTDKRSNQCTLAKDELAKMITERFQTLNNIHNITPKMMIDMGFFFNSLSQYYGLISTIFPYQLYFQIILENPNEKVKILALKQLSLFSVFPSFPMDEIVNSPFLSFLFNIFKKTTQENVLYPIINIFTHLLKTHPEVRNYFLNENALNILSEKLISRKIPVFLETFLIIQPILPPEIILQINFLYKSLLDQNNKYIICNTLRSITHLLKMKYSPFDFSFVIPHIDPFLDSGDIKVSHQTARMIGFLPFPTIQYSQKCITILTGFRDHMIKHTILKVFIRKYSEWIGLQDQIVEICLFCSSSDDTSFDDCLLCLKALLLYFPFHEYYDGRMCDLLIRFVTFPDVSYECLEKLTMMMQAEFEDDEKTEFMMRIQDAVNDFQAIVEENADEKASILASNFLKLIEET